MQDTSQRCNNVGVLSLQQVVGVRVVGGPGLSRQRQFRALPHIDAAHIQLKHQPVWSPHIYYTPFAILLLQQVLGNRITMLLGWLQLCGLCKKEENLQL